MSKVTKRPKSVNVTLEIVKRFASSYTCPTCKIRHVGTGISKNITRFKCDCGQELIIQ